MASKLTQNEKVLRHLVLFGSITPMEAMRQYGIMRLAARINELNDEVEIKSSIVHATNTFGEPVRYSKYTLIKGEQ